MAVQHIPWISPDKYLDQEMRSETKHAYYSGVIMAMAGGGAGAWNAGDEPWHSVK